jgi:hypothetical protein
MPATRLAARTIGFFTEIVPQSCEEVMKVGRGGCEEAEDYNGLDRIERTFAKTHVR